jgi:hypothetical protein
VIEYVAAAVLVLCPFVFGFAQVDAARNLFLAVGIALAAYSLVTNFYYSIAKIIPLNAHMALDVALGVLLMIAPAIFGYRDRITGGQYLLHFILGLGVIALVAFTRPRSVTHTLTSDMSGMGRVTDRNDDIRAA